VKDAIGHLSPIFPLKSAIKRDGKNVSHEFVSSKSDQHHIPRFHNNRDVSIFRNWVGGNMNSLNSEEKIKFYNDLIGKKSNHGKYRNLEWDKPSPTIVAHLYKDGLMFIHPDENQARSITVREAALLQSFPENYEFLGSQGTCFKMIGNAVPPTMAKGIALGITTILDKKVTK
jgi:DNA (cytosine-5)-methyltransferase 1